MAPTAKPASKPAAAGTKDKKLPAVPESKLKDAKRRLTTRGSLLLRKRIIKSKVALRKRQNLSRAERYTRVYLKLQRKVIEEAREAKKAGNIYIPERPKVAFVIRIRGWVTSHILRLHNLRWWWFGRFCKGNENKQFEVMRRKFLSSSDDNNNNCGPIAGFLPHQHLSRNYCEASPSTRH